MNILNVQKQFFSSINYIFIIGSCLILSLIPNHLFSQNLVSNGSFSLGTANWSTHCSIEINPEAVYGGSNITNLTSEIDVERCFNQNICILPGYTYAVSYKASRRINPSAPAAPGVNLKVVGTTTNIAYVNINQTYNNTTFAFQTVIYTFTIPAGSADKKVDIQFGVYNNTATYGVILDDITLTPATGSEWSIAGQNAPTLNTATSWGVNNNAGGIGYNWSFDSGSNPANSVDSAPSNVKWSTTGSKKITVALSNGSCTVTTLSKTVAVTGLLAVDFTSFTGVSELTGNRISWTTANEMNNDYFEVERSANGTSFITAGRVNAIPGAVYGVYGFIDKNAATGISYYRLRHFDKSNASVYSKIISINNNQGIANKIHLYPNPALSSIHFTLNSAAAVKSEVQVLSIAGNIVIKKSIFLQSGVNQPSLDIASLPAGMYYLRIKTENGGINVVQPFSKMN